MKFPASSDTFHTAGWKWLPALVLPGVLLLTGCGRGAESAAAAPQTSGRGGRDGGGASIAVTTADVVVKPMAVRVKAVGNAEASSTVEVRAQVTGELQSVDFAEGQDVTAGQLLFSIDPRTFEATMRQAQGTLDRDNAQVKSTESIRARAEKLFKDGLMSRAEYDAANGQATAALATASADTAALENARLQLSHTKILSPVSGRTGALLAHRGSLVRTTDTSPLVVINQMTPAFVSFAVPARLLPQIRSVGTGGALQVDAFAAGATGKGSRGTVSFIDNAVDATTDTIRIKATFPNADRRLWPGSFVEVSLQLSVEPHAVVVPYIAVQSSQQGQFVFVVKADRTVEVRPVTLAWTEADDAVISSGLAGGETVVIDGQLRLTPGARVSVKAAAPGSGDNKRP